MYIQLVFQTEKQGDIVTYPSHDNSIEEKLNTVHNALKTDGILEVTDLYGNLVVIPSDVLQSAVIRVLAYAFDEDPALQPEAGKNGTVVDFPKLDDPID